MPELAVTEVSSQIGFVLKLTMNGIWADLIATLRPFQLRPAQYAALVLIDRNRGCKQQDIANALSIQRANVVALIDELVKKGWVEREVNASNRRANAMSLSASGTRHLAGARAAHRSHERRVEQALDAIGAPALVETLSRLEAIVTSWQSVPETDYGMVQA